MSDNERMGDLEGKQQLFKKEERCRRTVYVERKELVIPIILGENFL
jgi:hypothetical protein